MKERYLIKKSDFVRESGEVEEGPVLFKCEIESDALEKLIKVINEHPDEEPEFFGVMRQELRFIDDIPDWETDDTYGECGALKRHYEFKLTDREKALADSWIQLMEEMDMSPDDMLRTIALARDKYERLKAER